MPAVAARSARPARPAPDRGAGGHRSRDARSAVRAADHKGCRCAAGPAGRVCPRPPMPGARRQPADRRARPSRRPAAGSGRPDPRTAPRPRPRRACRPGPRARRSRGGCRRRTMSPSSAVSPPKRWSATGDVEPEPAAARRRSGLDRGPGRIAPAPVSQLAKCLRITHGIGFRDAKPRHQRACIGERHGGGYSERACGLVDAGHDKPPALARDSDVRCVAIPFRRLRRRLCAGLARDPIDREHRQPQRDYTLRERALWDRMFRDDVL